MDSKMIAALMTCYYPDSENIKNIDIISKQVDKIFVCDNSPSNNKKMMPSDNEKIEYCFFGKNLGLSMAFNRILKEKKYHFDDDDFIIFFDQDSRINDGFISNLIKDYLEVEDKGYEIGCIGPVYFNNSSNMLEVPKVKTVISEKIYHVNSIITSSMLIKYSTLKELNFWNENVFLDMADWDLCWRLNQIGKMCTMSENVIMNHTLGVGEKRLGPLRVRVGSPIREYYQTRDCIYLLKEKYTPIRNKIMFIEMLSIRPVVHFLLLDSKKKRMKYVKRGIVDYFKKIRGVYVEK
ncbi:glycosyltransferase [Coprobacillus sp. AF33-1AC]|uniref:glycosyltransferase n=1 Tax=Coprobacillus sp. AF33-1AC TaxID=2292032 RepID=UPI0018F42BDF|nr:glycosyltransferase [Coprobacillus sp. AF33-1AC]